MDRPKRNDPPATQERRLIDSIGGTHKEQNDESAGMTTITDLDDASLGAILDFLPGHFRFVASVNRRFRFLYRHPPNTFYIAALTSDATREIWLEDDQRYVAIIGCGFAAKYGNLEAFQWLHYHGCRFCGETAAGGHLHSSDANTTLSMEKTVCTAAAANGRLVVLQRL